MTPLFSTAYLPPVAYMSALQRCTAAEVEWCETFPKQTYRNRAHIMTAGGVRALTVPVVRTNHSRTDEVLVDYKERWNVVHLRTLTAAYAASPYFLYYKDDLERLLLQRYRRLVDLNGALLDWLLGVLKIDCVMTPTRDFLPPCGDSNDLRYVFSPKRRDEATEALFPPYYQVFCDRQPFAADLSVVDVLMNLGPEAGEYLRGVSSPACA